MFLFSTGFCGAYCMAKNVYNMVHYFILQEERNKGIGKKLWKEVIDAIPEGSNIYLWGYDAILDDYRQNGFQVDGLEGMVYMGVPEIKALSNRRRRDSNPFDDQLFISIEPYSPELKLELQQYDETISPVPRQEYIERFFASLPEHVFVAKHNDRLVGWISAIPLGVKCYQIAPLYADSEEIASRLMDTLLGILPEGSNILVITTADTTIVLPFWTKLGLAGTDKPPLFKGRQLCTLKSYDVPVERVFSLLTGEFSVI